MGDTVFELRGHNFAFRNNDMGMQHLLTFSMSLRLPWPGRRWNSYGKWIEGGINRKMANDIHRGLVARGFGLAPTFLRSSEAMPKDLIDSESKATLCYFRKKEQTEVWIKLAFHGKKSPTFYFRMIQSKPAAADEIWKLEGVAYTSGIRTDSKAGQELVSHDPFVLPAGTEWRPEWDGGNKT